MYFKTLGCVMFLLLLVSACSKSGAPNNSGNNNGGNDTTTNNNPPPDFLIHTSYSASYGSSNNFFDKNSKVFSYNKTSNIVTVFQVDTVSGGIILDTITCKLINDSVVVTHSTESFKQTFYLNSLHNQIDSELIINGNQTITYKYENEFNNDNELISKKIMGIVYVNGVAGTPTEQTATYTWTNGNLVSSTNDFQTIVNTYDTKTLAAQPDALMIISDPEAYLNSSKNIVTSQKITLAAGNHISTTIDNIYDDKERVVQYSGSGTDGSSYIGNATYF